MSNLYQAEIDSNKLVESQLKVEAAQCLIFKNLGGTCLQDGDHFGAVIGDLPEGCAAFEKTRLSAIIGCVENLRFEEAKVPKKGGF